MEKWLQGNRALLFKHTRREGNKVADLLANLGVDCDSNLRTGTLDIIQDEDQKRKCHNLIQDEANSPDAGDSTVNRGDGTEVDRMGGHMPSHSSPPDRSNYHLSALNDICYGEASR